LDRSARPSEFRRLTGQWRRSEFARTGEIDYYEISKTG
jgi:hypothetical protein